MNADLAVVVLAGGEGRRMGGDKPRRPWGGTTLVARALDQARGYGHAGAVALAVRDAAQVAGAVTARLLLDDPDIEGPLAGLGAALAFAREIGAPGVLTMPCDAPRLPADLAVRLRTKLGPSIGVAVARSGGQLHPTCALWRAVAADALPAFLATGRRSLHGFAAALGMAAVDWAVDPFDPFANANTPDQLHALQPIGAPTASPNLHYA